ncbi:MAG: glycosyltransferase family 39 protein [Bacteroidales bacterium]
MSRVTQFLKSLTPNATVLLGLIVWWCVNLLQITFTELSNDEAYYHIYADILSWGYYDHPPMLALLIAMGEWVFGDTELGVRFFVILLQPFYLWIFWRLIRPNDATRSDAVLYVAVTSALLMLQLYGFVAVPDAPLMMTTVLYLAAYKGFIKNPKGFSWVWLSITMALMAYSKYQAALVVLFSIIVNPKILLQWRLYLSGAVTLLLFLPHFIWQYEHDFASFAYHLSGRNKPFKWGYVSEFILNMLVVFSVFYVPLWVQAYRKVKAKTEFERVLKWMPILFLIFFAYSLHRGRVQPQWLIPSCFGLVWILVEYLRSHPRSRKYAINMAIVTVVLVAITRLVMVFNPIGLKMDIFNNHKVYGAIADAAAGRPVIFTDGYANASKYRFYIDDNAFGSPDFVYRTSQWQYLDDSHLYGQEVVVQAQNLEPESDPERYTIVPLANGKQFIYYIDKEYVPLKRVTINNMCELPFSVAPNDVLKLVLEVYNPYDYPITVDGENIRMQLILQAMRTDYRVGEITNNLTLKAGETLHINYEYTIPADVADGEYKLGFVILGTEKKGWFAAPVEKLVVNGDN